MAKNLIFRGAATALITPLNESGIDFDMFGKLLYRGVVFACQQQVFFGVYMLDVQHDEVGVIENSADSGAFILVLPYYTRGIKAGMYTLRLCSREKLCKELCLHERFAACAGETSAAQEFLYRAKLIHYFFDGHL